MIIGFAGYARTGKHVAAHALEPEFKVVAFADKLREFLYTLNPIVGTAGGRLQWVIDHYGWEGYKETRYHDEVRRLIQTLGTDCGRRLISDTVWIDALFEDNHSHIAIADTRFINEAQAIKDRSGFVVRIEKPGVSPINNHRSEMELDGFDFDAVIVNDGSREDFQAKVRKFANEAKEW